MRIHTLGQFRVLADGEPLHLQSKASKPLQLLKVLIALGAESVSIDQLTDSLWPKADGDRAYGAFTMTLRRLRELVGHQGLILRAGRLTLNPQRCWVDAIDFGTNAAQAAHALQAGDETQAFVKFHEALECYGGPFLPGEFEPTEKLSARAQLHGMFLRNIETFGDYLQRQGKVGDAATLYRRALEIDDQSEEIYRRLMRCLMAQNRASECVAVYRQCCELLHAAAGTVPSAETEAIYLAALQRQPGAGGSAPILAGNSSAVASTLGEQRRATVACLRFHLPEAFGTERRSTTLQRMRWNLHAEALASAARHGGSIEARSDGTILAWFGYPPAHDDDPQRAARAVVELRDRLQGDPATSNDSPRLLLSAGITTGYFEVAPGDSGMERAPAGRPVSLAVELADAAEAGQVLADATTWVVIRDFFSGAPVPGGNTAGPGPADRYAVLRPVNITSRFEAALRRGLSPFVSREWELETLQNSLEAARRGQGQVVSVVGETGIGKTRLMHEFRHSIDRSQFWIVEGRCQIDSAATPYAPLVETIRRGTLIADIADPTAQHDLAVERLCASSPELKRYLPHLLHLLSIPSTQFPWPETLQGSGRRHALEDAVAELFASTSTVRPLVVIFEDWHWADEASDEALYALVRRVHRLNMLVVVVHRPEFQPKWSDVDHHRLIRLGPLNSTATAQLLRSVTGAETLPKSLETLVHTRTQGNPLFVEEMALALLAQNALGRNAEETPDAPDIEHWTLPATVDAVIRARIDRLAPEERELLRVAAVAGPTVDAAILERVAPKPDDVRRGLHRLAAVGLLRPLRLSSAQQYEFKHTLTQEVAHATLLPAQRSALHESVGAAIEALYPDEIDKHCEALAGHFEQSNGTAKAVRYLAMAGDKARRQQALRAARTCYKRAMRLLAKSDPPAIQAQAAVDLALKWVAVSEYAPSEELVQALRTACEAAEAIGDKQRLAEATYWMGRLRYILGELPAATKCFENALRLAEETHAHTLHARCLSALGRTCLYTAEHERGIAYLLRGLRGIEAMGEPDEVAYASHILAVHYCMLGDFTAALHHGEHAAALAKEKQLTSRQPMAQIQLAWVLGVRGNFAVARRTSQGATDRTELAGDVYTLGIGWIVDGWLRFMTGEQEPGIALMAKGIERVQSAGSNMALTQWHGVVAEGYALTGQLDKATGHASLALEIARGGQLHGACIAHRALAIVAGQREEPDREDHAMGESLQLAERLKERPYAALSHLRFANLLLRRGQDGRAKKHAAYARLELEAMGMTGWLPLLPC